MTSSSSCALDMLGELTETSENDHFDDVAFHEEQELV